MENLKLNNGWYYKIENNEITIYGRAGNEMELIIPQYIEGFPVKHIKSSAFKYDYFQGCKITSLTLPDGLQSIGYNAFFDHHIRDLVIPDTVTLIEDTAFYHICEKLFHTIKIPANVELGRDAIGEGFMEHYNICGKQAGTYVMEGYWYLQRGFRNRKNTVWDYHIESDSAVITGYHGNETEVIIPSEIDGFPVSTISGPGGGYSIFDYVEQEINSVIISEGIEKITKSAFKGISFKPQKGISNVVIPQSVTWIGEGAFSQNKLTNVTIPSGVTWIGDFAFSHNQLTSINLPDGITEISKRAFNVNKLSGIVIPENVTAIREYAFCINNLSDITIGSDVKLENESISREFTIEYESNGKKAGKYKYINERWRFICAEGIKTKINKNEQEERKDDNKSHNSNLKNVSFGKAVLATGITIISVIAAPFIGVHMLIKALRNESKKKNKSNKLKPKPEREIIPPQTAVNSNTIAVIFEDHVDIFGLSLPLDRGRFGGTGYHRHTGEVESFRIGKIIIQFNGQEIPVTSRMNLYRDGSFHGAGICKGVRYKHQNLEYTLSGGIFFYPSGNLKRFTTAEETETNFIVDGKKLVLHKNETVYFYENSGLPKTLINREWIDIDENGNVTGRFIEKSQIPDYD